jgi:hypothetical protein
MFSHHRLAIGDCKHNRPRLLSSKSRPRLESDENYSSLLNLCLIKEDKIRRRKNQPKSPRDTNLIVFAKCRTELSFLLLLLLDTSALSKL